MFSWTKNVQTAAMSVTFPDKCVIFGVIDITFLSDKLSYTLLLAGPHIYGTVLPAAGLHISENPEHEIAQRKRLEGGGEDDISALSQTDPHEHCPSIDVG